MNTGILYNTFVCFVIGGTGLAVFYFLRKARREQEVGYNQSLDCFALFLGLIWVAIGARALFTWLELPVYDIWVYKWIIGPLTFLHLLPAFYYFGWSFFPDKKKRWFFEGCFTLISLVAVAAFYRHGFSSPQLTYWGNNIVPNLVANNIFTFGMFVPGLLCIIVEVVRRYKKWKATGSFLEKKLLGFGIGFLAYAVAGIFETLIFTTGWRILLARIGIMVALLAFYLFATLEKDK